MELEFSDVEKLHLCLLKLQEKDYFTQEDWIKLDGLVHEGRYVFTKGPGNPGLNEPLLTFHAAPDGNIVSETAHTMDSTSATLAETPVEVSSDEGHTLPAQKSMFKLSESTIPAAAGRARSFAQRGHGPGIVVPAPKNCIKDANARRAPNVDKCVAARGHMPRVAKKIPRPRTPLLKNGSTHIARVGYSKTGRVRTEMDVSSGDHILIIKHNSGIVYAAQNQRTGACGQIPDTLFKPQEHQSPRAYPHQRGPSPTPALLDLDKIEGTNAAEWDDDPPIVSHPRIKKPPKPYRPRTLELSDLKAKRKH